MNTKSDCWLCGRGYGLENGGFHPGEMHLDFFGDLICIHCEAKIGFMGQLIAQPEFIQVVMEANFYWRTDTALKC
jgi:hypothetical protein